MIPDQPKTLLDALSEERAAGVMRHRRLGELSRNPLQLNLHHAFLPDSYLSLRAPTGLLRAGLRDFA